MHSLPSIEVVLLLTLTYFCTDSSIAITLTDSKYRHCFDRFEYRHCWHDSRQSTLSSDANCGDFSPSQPRHSVQLLPCRAFVLPRKKETGKLHWMDHAAVLRSRNHITRGPGHQNSNSQIVYRNFSCKPLGTTDPLVESEYNIQFDLFTGWICDVIDKSYAQE